MKFRLDAGRLGRTAIGAIAGLTLAASIASSAAARSGEQGCDPGERIMRFSHVTSPTGSPKGEAATELAKLINEQLDGELCMEVYPSSELFNDNEVVEALKRGDIELAAPATSKIDKLVTPLQIFSLPFMFRDLDALNWFQHSGPGARLLRSVRKQSGGLVGLGFWNNGMRQMSSTKPLLMPDDAKDLLFRVSGSDVQVATYQAIGAKAKKLSFKKVYEALASGEYQGQENTWPNILTKKFYEHQNGVTETNHSVSIYVLLTSAKFWDSLSTKQRATLVKILARVSAKQQLAVEKKGKVSRFKLQEEGVEIRKLDKKQRAAWVKAMVPVWRRFEAKIGVDLIEAAQLSNM